MRCRMRWKDDWRFVSLYEPLASSSFNHRTIDLIAVKFGINCGFNLASFAHCSQLIHKNLLNRNSVHFAD
jgi:hypothetical protein